MILVSSVLDIYVEEVAQRFTEDILEAEYMFPDGRMVSSMEYGIRWDDHASICNYFDSLGIPELTSSIGRGDDFWNLVQSGIGVIRISPETGVGLIAEGQNLTEAQKAIVELHSLKLEPYPKGIPITEELLQNKFNIKLEFVSDLQNKNTPIINAALTQREGQDKMDEVLDDKEKALGHNQEPNTGGELLNRNSSFLEAEASGTAPQPVEPNAQPDFPANVQLHFTIDEDRMSNKTFRKNMRTLNLYANTMRDSAQWYLKELAGSNISYVYMLPEESQPQILNVSVNKKIGCT